MKRISEGYFALLSRLTNKHGETHATSVRCERRSLKDERIGKWPEQILLKTYITISEGGGGEGSKFSKKKCTDQQEHVHLHVHQHVMHSCTCSSTCATPVNAHAHAHRIPKKKVHRRHHFFIVWSFHYPKKSGPLSLSLARKLFQKNKNCSKRKRKWPMNACCWDDGLLSTLSRTEK